MTIAEDRLRNFRAAGVSEHRAGRGDLVTADIGGRTRARVQRVDYVKLYLGRRQITCEQAWAARVLQSDWEQANTRRPSSCGASLDRVDFATQHEPYIPERAASFATAMRAVGIVLSPVLAHVVLNGRSAHSWASDRGRPTEDGIAALRLALDALVAHYDALALLGEAV